MRPFLLGAIFGALVALLVDFTWQCSQDMTDVEKALTLACLVLAGRACYLEREASGHA